MKFKNKETGLVWDVNQEALAERLSADEDFEIVPKDFEIVPDAPAPSPAADKAAPAPSPAADKAAAAPSPAADKAKTGNP